MLPLLLLIGEAQFRRQNVANHKSAIKRARQNEVRQVRNKSIRSRVKTAIRTYREALESGDLSEAVTALRTATRELRKASTKGIYHPRTASRRVSRLEQALNRAKTANG